MRDPLALRAAFLLLALAAPAAAQDPAKETAQPEARKPRILLFGDRSFDNHYRNAAAALKDEAELVRAPLGHLSTGAALERLDEILGDEPWDLIVFNFGLDDLMHRDPRTKRIRAMSPAAGGVPATALPQFATNLELLVERFRGRGAKLLWAHSMPLHPSNRSSAIVAEDIAAYNGRATAVMRAHDVAVFDTHAQIQAELDTVENPRGLDRFHNQLFKKDLSEPLVAGSAQRSEPRPEQCTATPGDPPITARSVPGRLAA